MALRQWVDLAGGVGLFLYGMHLMSSGLAQAASGPLQAVLERVTHTLPRAILTGAVVTAVVQSSSAVSLLVIGLAGSGILPLQGAAGVILGANIGTTSTGFLLFFASLGSDSAIPASLLCLMGAVLTLLCPKKLPAKVGTVLLGFGLLFTGLNSVQLCAAPLAHSDWFYRLMCRCPGTLPSLLCGALSSILLQSSSAAVGLLQALSSADMLPLAAAVPLILGQNMGTCFTPLAAARAAGGRVGRCCARFHLLFNTLGTALALLLWHFATRLHLIDPTMAATPCSVAVIHTLFNLGAVLVLAPFTGVLLRLCQPHR